MTGVTSQDPPLIPVSAAPSTAKRTVKVALKNVKDKTITVITTIGKVFSAQDIGRMVSVNLGAPYANQIITIALKGKAK